MIDEHFEFLNIILKISFNEALNKDILAQGELLSTKLFSVYLEETGIAHHLLPALDFMTIDSYDEPQVGVYQGKAYAPLAQAAQQGEEYSLRRVISAAMHEEKWTTSSAGAAITALR